MTEWIPEYADALGLELDDAEIEAVLALARDVAHGTERKNAPVAAFLAGRFVGNGGSLADAVERARRSLPPPVRGLMTPARGRSAQVMVRRGTADAGRVSDRVIVEEPLEIRLDDHLVTTTMRTPGHDYELAAGFLHGEGLLGDAVVRQVRYCATGSAVETEFNVVSVETGGVAPVPTARLVPTTSSCGLCGSRSVEELAARLSPLPEPAPVVPAVLAGVAAAVRAGQELFDVTGSVHAAAAFHPTTGVVDLVREDIGRHNAVDKVVGRLLLDGRLPATGLGLFVSGRASFEMVQKAWAAGFGLVAAVSGPSSLAVDAAQRANLALVGFLRGEAMNVYAP